MPNPRFETAQGTIDGVNQDFTVSEDYGTNTIVVFRNGQLLERSMDNGWSELGGNAFRMKVPPLPGDTIQAFYMDTLPSPDDGISVEVENIIGVIREVDLMAGSVEEIGDGIAGVIFEDERLDMVIERMPELAGVVIDTGQLEGTVQECTS